MIEFSAGPRSSTGQSIPCDCMDGSDASIGLRHFCVTQPERIDLNGKARRFMGSVLYPAVANSGNAARLTDVLFPRHDEAMDILLQGATPEDATYFRENLPRLELKAQRDAAVTPAKGGYPVLIFNPGGEGSRASCLPLGEALAAAGYIVLALDGVRDCPAQVFPDGEIISGPFLPDESYITPRIDDMRYLLDQLPTMNAEGPLAGQLDLNRIGALGNSRGGYLANIAAVEDDRIRAAVNMDGFLWGYWTDGTGLEEYPEDFQKQARSLKAPLLRLKGEQPSHQAAQDRFAQESQDWGGPFFLAALQGFKHGHFSSAPYLGKNPKNAAETPQKLKEHRQAAQVLLPILLTFFNATLQGKPMEARMKVRGEDFFAARSGD